MSSVREGIKNPSTLGKICDERFSFERSPIFSAEEHSLPLLSAAPPVFHDGADTSGSTPTISGPLLNVKLFTTAIVCEIKNVPCGFGVDFQTIRLFFISPRFLFLFGAVPQVGDETSGRPGGTNTMKKQSQERTNGSPRNESCANTGSGRTATSQSSREDVKSVGPVPLYLVPAVVASAVHRIGGALSELHVRRSGMHFYAVTMRVREEEEAV